jgi:hypothetical protein
MSASNGFQKPESKKDKRPDIAVGLNVPMALKTKDLKQDSSGVVNRSSVYSTGGNREKSQAATAATSNAVTTKKDYSNDP